MKELLKQTTNFGESRIGCTDQRERDSWKFFSFGIYLQTKSITFSFFVQRQKKTLLVIKFF